MPRRATIALAGAGAGAALVLLGLTWLLSFHVGIAGRADQSIFRGFGDLSQHPHVAPVATFIARLCNPQPYVYLAALPVLVALVRRRGILALAICAIVLGANETTQLLKPLLAQPRASLFGGYPPVGPASWPSGHATAAMALALCLVLAAPARLRPAVAALGAGFAVAVSYSFLALQWHYPSDVLGGFLVATVWTLLAAAVVLHLNRRVSAQTIEAGGPSLRVAVDRARSGGSARLRRRSAGAARPPAPGFRLHRSTPAWVVGAAGIAAAAITLASGVTVAVRR